VSRTVAAVLIACGLLAAAAGYPAAAGASHSQVTFYEAPRDLLDPAHRDGALAQLDSLGVRGIRIVLYWNSLAPGANSRTRPNFDATDPKNYNWGQTDPTVAAAKQRGWSILLTMSGPVPQWATAGARDHTTRPDPQQYQQFMTAAGRHFGTQIDFWSIWNEPNHPFFLDPQYVGHHQPASPRIYRGLVQAGVAGLHAAVPGAKVLMGETAPVGTGHDVAPLVFLRDTLCLDSHYHRASSCSPLPVDGYAHHAYTTTAGPFYKPPKDDVTIGVLSRLVGALDRAWHAGAFPHREDIYLTEFGIQSKPNPFLGVSLPKQAEYQEISEHIAWANPRVAAFSQYLLRDDTSISKPGSSLHGGTVGFQSGLELANGKPKPAYAGFRTPLVVHHSGSSVSLWGFVRPAHGSTTVDVQANDKGSKQWTKVLTAHTDSGGYWNAHSAFRNGRRWRVQWTSGGKVNTGPPIRSY
jgi:hypothetical protein